MTGKTTVTITVDGVTKVLEADSIIVFAADGIKKNMDDKVSVSGHMAFAGRKIPDEIFSKVYSDLTIDLVKKLYEGTLMEQAFNLFSISDYLSTESDRLNNELNNLNKEEFAKHMTDFILNQLH